MVGGAEHAEPVVGAVVDLGLTLGKAFVASMSAVLADAGCMVSAEPNPMYNDPV